MNPSVNPLLERCQKLLCLLTHTTVEVSQERAALEALFAPQTQESILIAGDYQAAPYTLLPWEEQIFFAQDILSCPLMVEYDDAFSIQITAGDGVSERYRTIADFREFWDQRLSQLRQCTIRLPQELLRQKRLIYFQMDGNLQQLTQAAKDCTGCILVVEASAAGLSEDYLTLGKWLVTERCIASRTALLLHDHGDFPNRALSRMADKLLQRNKVAVFRCGNGDPSLLPVTIALDHALRDLQDRTLDGMEEGIVRACCLSAQAKYLDALQNADRQEKHFRSLADKYQEASQVFRRMYTSEMYGLSQIFTEQEQQNVCDEVHCFFKQIRDSLPAMIKDVADSSDNANEDLKNLAGDYLNDLIDQFVDTLLDEVAIKDLVPKTQTVFQEVCGRFRRLMQDPTLEYARLEGEIELEFLQMVHINVGNYQNTSAHITSTLLSGALRLLLTRKFGFWGYHTAENLREVIYYLFVTSRYAKDLTKKLLETLEEQEATLIEYLRSSVFPRLIHVLQEEFGQLGEVYYRMLHGRHQEYEAQANAALSELTKYQEALHQLIVLTPADASPQNS